MAWVATSWLGPAALGALLRARPLLSAATAITATAGTVVVARRGGRGTGAAVAQLLARLKARHAFFVLAVVVLLVPQLRRATGAGLSALGRLCSNLVGLATGRLAITRVSGELTIVEKS